MSQSLSSQVGSRREPTPWELGSARTVLLLAVCFLLGVALSAAWFYVASKRGKAVESTGPPAIQLAATTQDVLSRLSSPVQARYYALLDPATLPETWIAFAARVEQLLAAYQQESGGNLTLTNITSMSVANANAALADGITAFNADKGETCYLGVTLVLNGHKETLPHLSPDWEPALESDLTRALMRLVATANPLASPTALSQTDTAAVQQVKALIPNVAATSVEDGKRILRDAALKDFTAAAKEMQGQIKEAEEALRQAQTNGTPDEQQAAVKHLQQIQAEQTQRLKQIAAQSKAQIDVFLRLKQSR